MFWSRKNTEDTPLEVKPIEPKIGGKWTLKTNIVNVRKADNIDIEFIRRSYPKIYTNLDLENEVYYIVTKQESVDFLVVNSKGLETMYSKIIEVVG